MFTVVNVHKEKCHIYCGRTGRGLAGTLGNYTPDRTALSYWRWFVEPAQSEYRANFYALCVKQYGTTMPEVKLGCFCKPKACHADALAVYANARLDGHDDADACLAVRNMFENS